uniref:suppressor APC domain-containing protein 2 n=1 Tax=Myxine glutinosa TaxID=7769 RepID=UPI00358E115F
MDRPPSVFLQTVRPLFNLLDDEGRGIVNVSVIEAQWHSGHPNRTILSCLRRFADSDGFLSFERFAAALRLAALSADTSNSEDLRSLVKTSGDDGDGTIVRDEAVQTAAASADEGTLRKIKENPGNCADAAPAIDVCIKVVDTTRNQTKDGCKRVWKRQDCITTTRARGNLQSSKSSASTIKKSSLEENKCAGKVSAERSRPGITLPSQGPELLDAPVHTGFVGSALNKGLKLDHSQKRDHCTVETRYAAEGSVHLKTLTGEKVTILNDNCSEMDQEQDLFLQGLQAVERAHSWLCQQPGNEGVQRSQGGVEEVSRNRTRAMKVKEAVRRLLMEIQLLLPASCSENKMEGSLACASRPTRLLREQNRMLSQEVAAQGLLIVRLQREKEQLIRQLFEARSHSVQDGNPIDSTFI